MTTPHEFPVYARLGLTIVEAEGSIVRDDSGREYVDFYGGHAAALLGHGHPRLVTALADQARRLLFQTNLVDIPVRDEACHRLASFAPEGLDRVFLVNSGAEANENALRLAFRTTGRERLVAVGGAFHGRTAGAAAVSDGSSRWYAFPRTPFDVTFVPPDDGAALHDAVDDRTAAVILEAVQGVAGARPLSKDYLRAAREATCEAGALLIADEVQCGMGRTGEPFAFMHAAITPDIVTTAKGLAGGFPAGAVLARDDLAQNLKPGDLGTTFGGGPLASRLIIEVLDIVEGERLPARARRFERRVRADAAAAGVTDVQGRGCLLGLRTKQPAREVLAALRERGILAGGAADPHVVRLMPPLTIEDHHLDNLIGVLRDIAG